MPDSDYDYSEYKEKPKNELTQRIEAAAIDQKQLKIDVADSEEVFNKKKAALKANIEVTLPTLMDEAGQSSFRNMDGSIKFNLVEKIRASIPKENPFPSFTWLEQFGEGRLIKNKFTVEVDNLDKEASTKLTEFLEENNYEFKADRSVNHNSLGSTISDMMSAGIDVPADKFNVFRQRSCKVK